jgi:hypothetical protein
VTGKAKSDAEPRPVRCLARFVGIAILITIAAGTVGFIPTRRMIGEAAATVIGLGSGASLFGAICGAAVLVARRGAAAREVGSVVVQAMLVRIGATGALATLAAVSKAVPTAPLLLWVAISYVVLLPVDTHFAVRMVAGGRGKSPSGGEFKE